MLLPDRLVEKLKPVATPPRTSPPPPAPVNKPAPMVTAKNATAVNRPSKDVGKGYGGDVVGRRVGAIIREKQQEIAAGPPKNYCFEFYGKKWGRTYPGKAAFTAQLIAHGVDPNDWIVKHLQAAVCIGMSVKAKKPPIGKKPGGGPLPNLVLIPAIYCQGGAERWVDARFLDDVIAIYKRFSTLVSSAYRTVKENEDAGGATNSDHLRGWAVDFVGMNYKALYTWALKQKYPYVEPMSQSVTHCHISFQHGGVQPPDTPGPDYVPLKGMAFVNQVRASCDLYDIDPLASFANALNEGISGKVGDNGNAFGPWQMWLLDGRMPMFDGEPLGSDTVNRWAWSAAGIQEAHSEAAADGANHTTGPKAVYDFVYLFERPSDKAGAYATRLKTYNDLVGRGDKVWAYLALRAGGDTNTPIDLPNIPDVSPVGVPKTRAVWVDLKTYLAHDLPIAGQHATTVGNRLLSVVSSRPWTRTKS